MSHPVHKFLKKIEERKITVCIVGLGQVGLPTALLFADAGFTVTGYDINEKIIHTLNAGRCHFNEPGLNALLSQCIAKKRFRATSDFPRALKESDVVIICVATPLGSNNRPNLDFLKNACGMIAKNPLKDKLVVIESSIPPGTTRNLVAPILRKNRHALGKDFWVVYIPERLAPGQAIEEIARTARIIGSYDATGAEMARALYKNVIKNDIVVTDVNVAETSKLVENTYRDVNIAFANETAKICESLGIDIMEVIRVANTHPRVHVHTPGVGVGGPCIPKDPHLLISPVGGKELDLKVIPQAREVNDSMPEHFTDQVEKALLRGKKRISGASVLCLGVTYKGNVSDTRDSPAQAVIQALRVRGAEVSAYDPISTDVFGAKRVKTLSEGIKQADAVLILTDHDEFKKLDWKKVGRQLKKSAILADGRRIVPQDAAKALKDRFIAVGYGTR